MCLNEIHSKVHIVEHLSHAYRIWGSHSTDCEEFCLHFSDAVSIQNSLKQGDASLPLLLNFSLEYAVEVQEDQE